MTRSDAAPWVALSTLVRPGGAPRLPPRVLSALGARLAEAHRASRRADPPVDPVAGDLRARFDAVVAPFLPEAAAEVGRELLGELADASRHALGPVRLGSVASLADLRTDPAGAEVPPLDVPQGGPVGDPARDLAHLVDVLGVSCLAPLLDGYSGVLGSGACGPFDEPGSLAGRARAWADLLPLPETLPVAGPKSSPAARKLSEGLARAGDRRRWDARYRDQGVLEEPAANLVALADFMPRRGTCLDLAAGAGRNSLWLARRGLAVTACDLSPVALRLARQRAGAEGLALATLECDLERGELPEGPFALVVCHHFLDRGVLARIPEMLVPGGALVMIHPTTVNLERHPRPGRRFLLAPGELEGLVGDLVPMTYEESWKDDRHEARVVARRN